MCSSPVLTQPNFEKRFYLQTDALAYGVGAVLLQEGEKPSPSLEKQTKPTTHPVAYYSATFTPTERNYDIYKRELLAIMKSLVTGSWERLARMPLDRGKFWNQPGLCFDGITV
jgi:RNase H-like domain found in reverse transcriptase